MCTYLPLCLLNNKNSQNIREYKSCIVDSLKLTTI